MSKKYEELKNKYCPDELIKDMAVAYYGEENRKKIEKQIDNTSVVFVAKNLNRVEVKDAFRKQFPNATEEEINKKAAIFIKNLQELNAEELSSFAPNFIAQNSKIFQLLGFDVSKILLRHKATGALKLNEKSEETQKVINYGKYSISKKDINEDVVDIDKFIQTYNNCANRKETFKLLPTTNNLNGKLEISNHYAFPLNDYSNLGVEYPKLNITNNKDKKFLADFLASDFSTAKGISESEKYIVDGINRIFNRNHTSYDEILQDRSLDIFFDIKKEAYTQIYNFIIEKNVNKTDFVASDEQQYNDAMAQFKTDLNTTAFHDANKKTLNIPVHENISFGSIAHEFNHAIGTNDENQVSAFSGESTGLNEIFNEFLTMRMMDNYKDKIDSTIDIKKNRNSNYHSGIDVMMPFLSKYEGKIKECQLSDNAPKVLQDFIGKSNYEKLKDYANLLAKNQYGKFCSAIVYKGKKIVDINQFMQIYKQDTSIMEMVPKNELEKVEQSLEYNKFMEQLVEHYEEFEKGDIVDISLESELNKTEENVLMYTRDDK